jgi:hypothetical protein
MRVEEVTRLYSALNELIRLENEAVEQRRQESR